jgi:hypothetical protein
LKRSSLEILSAWRSHALDLCGLYASKESAKYGDSQSRNDKRIEILLGVS